MLQSEVLNATEETLLEARDKKIVTKKLQLEDPANVPANLIDYLKEASSMIWTVTRILLNISTTDTKS